MELRAAAAVLGVRDLSLLDYRDQELDRADPREAIGRIVTHLRRVRPQVVITFAPDGAYGHPDHVAICQFTTAAVVAAADPGFAAGGTGSPAAPHAVSKLYYIAWPAAAMAAYEEAFRKLVSKVDGVEREASPWPDWSLSCVIQTRAHWETVWRAVSCHESQITAYEKLAHLSPESHEALWGWQSYYRALQHRERRPRPRERPVRGASPGRAGRSRRLRAPRPPGRPRRRLRTPRGSHGRFPCRRPPWACRPCRTTRGSSRRGTTGRLRRA